MSAAKKMMQQKESLGRFLVYVLGHRPDEFGLVADEQGWVSMKDLLRALSEEEGFRNVRESRILEVLRDPERPELEASEGAIRVKPEYTELELGAYRPEPPPKLLYHAARHKAYPAIVERGLAPSGGRAWVVLFPDREMALRVGRRRDPEPVLLTVQAGKADKRGVVFYRLQEFVYLVERLEPDLFTGPPLPKEKEEPERKRKEAPPKEPPTPGSFILDPTRVYDRGPQPLKGKKGKREDVPDWKRAARKDRSRGK